MTSWLSKTTFKKLLYLAGLHCTTSEEAGPSLHSMQYNLLSRPLLFFRLEYCNAILAGLPSYTIKPLQMIQNAAARLVFCEPKIAHVKPLYISLHWLQVAARIKFNTLMLAYRTATGCTRLLPLPYDNLHPLPKSEIWQWATPRGAITERHKITLRTFSFNVPGWWNELPTLIWKAESLLIFKRHLKMNLFRH